MATDAETTSLHAPVSPDSKTGFRRGKSKWPVQVHSNALCLSSLGRDIEMVKSKRKPRMVGRLRALVYLW